MREAMEIKAQEEARQRKIGLMIVVAGVTAISFDALLIRLAETTSWTIIFWRGLFTFVSLSLVLGWTKGKASFAPFAQTSKVAWASAFLFGTGGMFFVSSVMFTSVANTVVIISSAPLFAAMFTRILGIELIPWRTWMAIALALCGVFLVFAGSLGQGSLLGDFIAVLAACNAGGNLTMLRRHPQLSRMPLVCVGGLIMAVLVLPLADPFQVSPWGFFYLAVMGLVQMPLALFLIAQSTRYLPSPEVSLFLIVETVFAPIWVWFVLGEVPPGMTFVGGGLIVLTLVVHSWMGMREIKRLRRVAAKTQG
ncbi:MAG: DMT family transporter [Desulfovermiculus sp.]|nr:DMT family transporter [Desulfovermiculus sp.]